MAIPALPVAIRAAAPQEDQTEDEAAGQAAGIATLEAGSDSVDDSDEESSAKLIWTPLVLGGILSLAFLSRLRRRRLRDTPPS